MVFVKVVKNKAYFKRYQVKYRRRREGKTDYRARRRLIIQDRDKYSSPKYRLVVRKTNTKIICQIVCGTLVGDKVLAHASSPELKKFGLTAGLTNYAASYCTGLLCARRLLTLLNMDKMYKGEAATGAFYDVYKKKDIKKDHRPFKAFLDIGLAATTTGNKVFGAMKGACDGGLCIPHSKKRFPGYSKEEKKEFFDVDVHREHIFGLHVDAYMEKLEEEDPDKYQKQFRIWDKCLKDNKTESLEELYTKIHDCIKKDPMPKKIPRPQAPVRQFLDTKKSMIKTSKATYSRSRKLTKDEKKEGARQKLQQAIQEQLDS
jgi:large subunit ribosomal protein L5e